VQFTVDAFNAENPTHSFVRQLSNRAFGRGLPLVEELLGRPNIASFFRTLIRQGEVKGGEAEQGTVGECHRNGWIHSDMDEEGTIYYSFPSPLHSVFVSWLLHPSDDMPNYTSPFELCLAVISKFKPSQMHTPIRRVGTSGAITQLPEAQYQDEFYRSIFSATAGNVRISPEFATARGAHVAGRIDFFIPVVNWGIEITREGNRLLEHDSRFKVPGAYGAWLESGDMSDYILLDCRTTVPRKPHPNILNLYHAVFSNQHREVSLYNNQLDKLGETIGSLENHF